MKFTYHPDIDSLLIRFDHDFGKTTVNITHLAQAWLGGDDRIKTISIAKASRQFTNTDLATSTPEVTWQVPEHGINVTLAGGSSNGLAHNDKLTLAYFLESDVLHLNFTDGPADIVVDITGCDIADINTDGTLNGITLAWATDLLQIEDVTTYIPEFQWNVHERKPSPAIAT